MGWRVPLIYHTITGIYGMVPDRLFSVGFLRVLRFPPTAIRQMVKGLWDWIRQGWSALESVKRRRLSAIKVWIELNGPVHFSYLANILALNGGLSQRYRVFPRGTGFSRIKCTGALLSRSPFPNLKDKSQKALLTDFLVVDWHKDVDKSVEHNDEQTECSLKL